MGAHCRHIVAGVGGETPQRFGVATFDGVDLELRLRRTGRVDRDPDEPDDAVNESLVDGDALHAVERDDDALDRQDPLRDDQLVPRHHEGEPPPTERRDDHEHGRCNRGEHAERDADPTPGHEDDSRKESGEPEPPHEPPRDERERDRRLTHRVREQ